MLHRLNDAVSDSLTLSFSLGTDMLALQQIIVQPSVLVDGSQRGGGYMELDRFIQHFRIQPLELDVGVPFASRLLLRERYVVPETDVLSVV